MKLLYEVSRKQLYEISELYEEAITQNEFIDILHVKIKNFTENLKSVIDYTIRIVFHLYCDETKHIPVYYPLSRKKEQLDNSINGRLPNLRENHLVIYQIVKNNQPCNNVKWISELNDLCNKYKHVELPVQIRKDLKICKIKAKNGDESIIDLTKNRYLGKGRFAIVPGGKMQWKAGKFIGLTDELNKDFYGWKVKDLPSDDLNKLPHWKDLNKSNIEYFEAANFYFTFDTEGNDVYTRLYSYYRETEHLVNSIIGEIEY